jgi:predicted phage terminase large subunit-like protein
MTAPAAQVAVETTSRTIGPQAGRQTMFLSTPADIAIYGGAAGGGKSYALLLEPLRHVHNAGFRAIFFRRTSPELRSEGGLWDTSRALYAAARAKPREAQLDWTFASGARIKFSHLEHETDKNAHAGSQYAFLGFDEVNMFTEGQFWFLLSRNRSACGVRPYVRATCNPDPTSWVAGFISWWIDQETGLAINERIGVLRWFIRFGSEFLWGETRADVVALAVEKGMPAESAEKAPLSLTFIAARLTDNPLLLQRDPGYEAKLMALSLVDRERLLSGNWLIREAAGNIFKERWFRIVDERAPANATRVRYWDLAASEDNRSDETAGALIAMHGGRFWIEDVVAVRERPHGVESLVRRTAEADGKGVTVWIEQEAIGSVGEHLLDHYKRNVLAGWAVYGGSVRGKGNKTERAKPCSAAAEAGNISMLRGPWNKKALSQLEAFPTKGMHDDIVDAIAGAFSRVAEGDFAYASV